ncbi:MAG: AMP-binding protein [Chloroflexi bacterium]|nr:AMP-binding protein [Chloroflexota bacterium]
MLIGDGLWHWARLQPGRTAIRCGDRTWSYGALANRVRAVAVGLGSHLEGRRTSPVALLVSDQAELLPWFLAIVEAGGVAAPLNPSWTNAELALALEVLQPDLVLTERPIRDCPVPVVLLDELDPGRRGPVEPNLGGREVGDLGTDPSSPFYIGFTSGSTGAPKGVVRSHRAWVNSFFAMSLEFGIGRDDAVVVPGSLYFSFSLIAALHALFIGATVVLLPKPDPRSLLTVLESTPSTVYLLPSVLNELVRLAERKGVLLPRVGRIICAGEKLSPDTKQCVTRVCPGAALYEYYGASELGYVSVLGPEDHDRRPDSVGRPFIGTRVAVLDEEGRPVPAGEIGLLCAQTEYGFSGYWRCPDLDDWVEHFGWRTAGDLARQDSEGFLSLVGRRDNMVVIRGENVYPEEVETVIASLPGVTRAVVLAEPQESPTHLVAVVQTATPGLEAERILRHCRVRLSARKTPRRVVLVPDLPTTATGKLARERVRDFLRRADHS